MRIAVLSDIHGNVTAMEKVLERMVGENADAAFFAGDLSLYGARPVATLRLLAENPWLQPVHGNTDLDILSPPELPDDATPEQRDHLRFKVDTVNWALDQFESSDLDFIRAMPFSRRVSPTSDSRDDLLVVHANPKDVQAFVMPPAAEQEEKLGSLVFSHSDEEREALLNGVHAGCVAHGHVHFPNVQRFGDMTLANIASVSNPMDGDPRAKYGLLTWTPDTGWAAEIRYVEYDVGIEQAQLRRARPPKWRELAGQFDGKLFLG